MSSRSAIHQLRATRSRVGSSSQANSVLHGWTPEPETEREPDPSEGPPLSDFARGLPRRNRAPSGRRPSVSKPTATNREESRQRRPSLVEKLRAAAGRRPSETKPSAVFGQGSRKRGSSKDAPVGRRLSNASLIAANDAPSRKRGPSLVAKAKEMVNRPRTNTNAEPSFPRLTDLSRHEKSASENEKVRLSIESMTRSFELIQRWKEPTDWLKPSNWWKRNHPAMNFRLWRIIQRNPLNHFELRASAERNVEAARLLYEQKGGFSGEWWPEDLEEEILDSWSLSFGGRDPPRSEWTLPE
ncbi:hypothetical protein HO173_001425 [Letharia columbiana]|uniref:Uncharacterized protein n=1 Tax=Letharia columbiana TaxID=112416 RepID=A0A8H6G5D8_9LECA|nr:uncharacterized protein HO173_001425 [Letharia columbiana]KAF6240752.1 hypothetical protein HO173_001425 [Letharia columbiana]